MNSRLRLADDDRDRKDKTKDMVFDLVRSHISSLSNEGAEPTDVGLEVDDIIPGKGKGLVIVLYGMPFPFSFIIAKSNIVIIFL